MRKALVVLAVSMVLGGCGVNGSPGDGEKIGQIVKMSSQGVFCKTYEAELIRGGMSNGSGSFGTTPFDFTVPDAMAEKVKAAMQDQTEVVITYEMEGLYSACRSDSYGHFLTSIRPAAEVASK